MIHGHNVGVCFAGLALIGDVDVDLQCLQGVVESGLTGDEFLENRWSLHSLMEDKEVNE